MYTVRLCCGATIQQLQVNHLHALQRTLHMGLLQLLQCLPAVLFVVIEGLGAQLVYEGLLGPRCCCRGPELLTRWVAAS